MKTYRAGVDIGSTTVKLVVLNDENQILFGEYHRHHANTQATLKKLLEDAKKELARANGKLGNNEFVSKAPAKVIEEQRTKLANLKERVAKIDESINSLMK